MIDNHVTEIVRNDLSHFLSLIIWICNQYKENQSNHSYTGKKGDHRVKLTDLITVNRGYGIFALLKYFHKRDIDHHAGRKAQ